MILYPINCKHLFIEMIEFLNYYYNNINLPISIQKPLLNEAQILYNTEQLTRPEIYQSIFHYLNNTNIVEIWDYSLENIKILNDIGIYNTKHIPLKIWPDYRNKLETYCTRLLSRYDVGFCGWVHGEHRVNILNDIKKAGISLDIIQDLYGDERDKRLAQCKIVLNIHFDENYKIFEQYRCFPWLDIGKTVLSEHSLDNDPRCINVSYDEIVPTLMKVLNK